MAKKNPFWLLLVPLLFIPGCSREPARDLPPTIVWHKDQNLIRPQDGTLNVWEGFRVDKDAFTADRDIAQFILWRARKEKVTLWLEYSLQGRKVEFAVNVNKRRMLTPSVAFKRQKFELPLSRGMNFLQFSKKKNDKLSIRSIAVGEVAEKTEPQLRSGESFSIFLLPGRGSLVLQGRGRVKIIAQRDEGAGQPGKVLELKSGWLSGKISHAIDFSSPGLLTVAATQGDFDIRSYAYAENPPPAVEAKSAWKNNPNIYIVLSDACQASHLGTYGYERNTSPSIDAFARDAVVYENAYSNAVFTRSSVATILTGLYPDRHKVRVLHNSLPKQLLTLPEFLKVKGYRSSILTSTFAISPHFGYTQGVDDYFRVSVKSSAVKDVTIANQFKAWLQKAPIPHFSYMHYLHPHFPLVPPADFPVSFLPGKARPLQERQAQLVRREEREGKALTADELREVTDIYDSSIAWIDSEFGKILSALKARNLYDESMIIFIADHGEALGEHGVLGHGGNVYPETARVPLIVKYPRSLGIQGRETRLSELADIFPTIASLFQQHLDLDGCSLLAKCAAGEAEDRLIVSRTFNRCPRYGLRWKNWYYMIDLANNHDELYALDADLEREVGDRYPRVKAFLNARFLAWYARFRNGQDYSIAMNLKNLPADEIEEMKTLGYL
jgi:arylsulfatase